MAKTQRVDRDQSGIASIFVVITLMTILALISIGFSHLMNREVRQALDRQLSAEAYFAAESGLNDARDYLADGGTSFTGCPTPSGDPHFVDTGNISEDAAHFSKYTCVSINTTPKELDYGPLQPGQSIVVKLSGASLNSLSRLYFSWENAKGYSNAGPQPLGTCTVTASVFCQTPQNSSLGNDDTGLLRVGIYPAVSSCSDSDNHGNRFVRYSAVTDSTDAALECASRNYFLYPNSPIAAPNSIDYRNAVKDGSFVPGNCNPSGITPNTSFSGQATPRYCSSYITNLYPVTGTAGAATANSYYIRLTAVYKPLSVSIQATDNTAPTPNALPISDAEGVVDVTGQGNDVLRRVQARVPLQNTFPVNYGLQSMESICKLFRNYVTDPGIYAYAALDNSAGAYNTDNNGQNCQFPTGGNSIDNGGVPPVNIEPPATVNLSANPSSVSSGGRTTLSWTSTDADTCTASGGPWSGNFGPSGSVSSGSISSTTTFTITCTGPGGTGSDSVTVTVSSPPSPPVINKWIPNGGNSFIYNVSNANRCEIHVNNPPGGVQPIGLILNTDFPATAGNPPSGGTLWCWNGSTGPVISNFVQN